MMRDYTACAVFMTPTADGWHARCYDHDPYWEGEQRPHNDKGLDKAIADADRHDRVEHPNA